MIGYPVIKVTRPKKRIPAAASWIKLSTNTGIAPSVKNDVGAKLAPIKLVSFTITSKLEDILVQAIKTKSKVFAHFDPDENYVEWLHPIFAFHHGFGGDDIGKELARTWSMNQFNHDGGITKNYDEEQFEKKWASAGNCPNPLTIATYTDQLPKEILSDINRKHKMKHIDDKNIEPIPIYAEKAPQRAFPVSALGPFAGGVSAIAQKTQAPIAIAAQSILSIASFAVQGFADVQKLEGDTCPTSLYFLTIARSGERKSTTDSILMKTIQDHQKLADQHYSDEVQSHNLRMEIWDKKRKKSLKSLFQI